MPLNPRGGGDIAASCVPVRRRPAVLPEQKEVALLVAVAAQWLTDHVVVRIWVIPGLRRQTSQSEVGGGASPRDLPHTCVPAARLTWHRAWEETVAIVPLPPGKEIVLGDPRTPLHPLVEIVQELPHGHQVAVSDLLDEDDIITTHDLGTRPVLLSRQAETDVSEPACCGSQG